MARTDNDSWDLASSVGATATAVAASRAVASQGPDALLDDPFAEPLVRAVGLDEFVKVVDGESFDEDDPVHDPQSDERADRRPHKVFRRLLHRRRRGRDSAGGDSGRRPGHPGLPVGLARGHRCVRDRPARGHRVQDRRARRPRRRADGATARPSPSICATTGRQLCVRQGSIRLSRPRGSPRACCRICRPTRRTGCSTTSPPSRPPGSRLATEHMDMTNLPDDWADRINDRWRRAGSDINLSDLFYHGERNEARDYLSSHGWHVTVASTRELYDGHGFTLPDDELVSMMGDSGYLTAILA